MTNTSFIFKQDEIVCWLQGHLNEEKCTAATLHECGLVHSEPCDETKITGG